MDPSYEQMLDVRDVHGKGKGLVATRLIPKGTCILSETPIITIPVSPSTDDLKSLWQDVMDLPNEQKQAFEALSNCHPYDNIFTQYMSIVRTNCFSVRDGRAGVCLDASRINHACDSNAQHTWNDLLGRIMVHALRDIAEDEEITTSYMERGHTRQERQAHLQKTFKFECACELCSLPAALSDVADRKALRARKLWAYFDIEEGHTRHLANPLQRLQRLEEIAQLRTELNSCTQMHDAHMEAAALALSHSDLARGKTFLVRAYNSYILEHGDNDEVSAALRPRLQDPTGSSCYGQSTRWQTNEHDAPPDEFSDIFEEWLWKKKKDQPKDRLFADLCDRRTFIGIGGLPTEGLFDVEYHQDASMGQSKPKRHWCFIGEIMDKASAEGQLQLMVKDVDSHITGIFFHDPHMGAKISGTLGKHDTVVVLYAQRGESDAGAVVKIRRTSMIKAFPLTLKGLVGLSDRMRVYATPQSNLRTCHGCAKGASHLQKCSRCGLFWYCNNACQKTGWNHKDHKTDCKMLKNADLRSLFTFRWHEFKAPVRFPLPSLDAGLEVLAEKTGKMTF